MIKPLYQYRAEVQKVYDGDTITKANIDLGFGIKIEEQNIRLYGIDTKEMRDSKNNKRTDRDKLDAVLAKELLIHVTDNCQSILRTYKTSSSDDKDKKGKYGRWLADVYAPTLKFHDLPPELKQKLDERNPEWMASLESYRKDQTITALTHKDLVYWNVNHVLVCLGLAEYTIY